jgi:hypothetical protein
LILPRNDDPHDDVGGEPPCFLHELGPNGVLGLDPRQARDVARWRKAERDRLIGTRLGLSADHRAAQTLAIAGDLSALIPTAPDTMISVYWPIKAEPDLRPWMHAMWEREMRIGLSPAQRLRCGAMLENRRPLSVYLMHTTCLAHQHQGVSGSALCRVA